MRCGVVFGSHNVSYSSVMPRRACLGGVGMGWGENLREMEILFAQSNGFLGYFDFVFAMLSSNVGESEKPGLLLLLAQIFNGSLTTKDARLLPAFVVACCTTSCRTLATKRLARGLVPPKAYNLALSCTGTCIFVAVVVLNIYNMKLHLNRTEMSLGFVHREYLCPRIFFRYKEKNNTP